MNWKVLFLGAFAMSSASIAAQDVVSDLKVEARMDYQHESLDGEKVSGNTGFKGKYVNIQLGGTISEGFTYSYRQRLVKPQKDMTFWDATDWLWVGYKIDDHWDITAGKDVVMIGGYEYDRAPIDLYMCSEYWNNIPCYQMGVHLGYTFNGGKDKFIAQVCQSPFARIDSLTYVYGGNNIGVRTGNHSDMYAYNLIWYGSHGAWSTIWSANMSEYADGKYISYLALGNQFQLGNWRLQLDFMNRAADHQTYFFKDCSVMAELAFKPSDKLNVYAKGSYDVNKAQTAADFSVLPGTEITRLGGGLEYFPRGNDNVRLHACYSYSFGTNGNVEGALNDKQSFVDMGITWRIRPLKK